MGRLVIVAALGVALGVAGFLAIRTLTVPGPRPADGWALRAAMPGPRGETAGAVADGRLYVIGGMAGLDFAASADVSVYDHSTEGWASAPSLPEARHHAAAAAIEGSVYVSGGGDAAGSRSASMFVLGPGEPAWTELAPLPEARLGHRMVALDGLLYVVGGAAGSRTDPGTAPEDLAAGSVLVYDPASDAWSAGAPIPLVRDHLAVVVVGAEIWAIGGRAGGANHARVDIYDPDADAWRAGPPLPEPTSGAAEAAIDGIIYISGGEDPAAGRIIDRHWRLAAGSAVLDGFWRPLPIPPLAVHGAAGANLDGHFVIVGGSALPGGQSNAAWTGALQRLLADP